MRPLLDHAPFSMTRMRWAWRIVESRCAITKRDAIRQHSLDGRLNRPLGLRIHGAGRLIHHKKLRIGNHGTRQRDQLLLPLERRLPPSPDRRVVPLGQRGDEVVGIDEPRGGFDFGVGRLRRP